MSLASITSPWSDMGSRRFILVGLPPPGCTFSTWLSRRSHVMVAGHLKFPIGQFLTTRLRFEKHVFTVQRLTPTVMDNCLILPSLYRSVFKRPDRGLTWSMGCWWGAKRGWRGLTRGFQEVKGGLTAVYQSVAKSRKIHRRDLQGSRRC